MRVVAGLDGSSDLGRAGIDRHALMLSTFINSGKNALLSPELRTLTLVLRSASSDPALALLSMKDELLGARIRAKAIVARLEPEDGLRQLFTALAALSPNEPANELIRWAKNPRLAEAHEQVTCGNSLCWSGDAIRRDAGKRNALALFDEHSPDAIRRTTRAFMALWQASTCVPPARLSGAALHRPSGSYETLSETSVVPSALRAVLQGWPLVRH
ncbi:MAG TPA: hypothetical protein VIG52_10965 [Methyloceanibacter sp.]|jgi:hypothetical protein